MSRDAQNNKVVSLSPSEVMIIQQLYEDGEGDVRSLPGLLGISRQQIITNLDRLRSKGLVSLDKGFDDLWVHLTDKSRRIVALLWPEAQSLAH